MDEYLSDMFGDSDNYSGASYGVREAYALLDKIAGDVQLQKLLRSLSVMIAAAVKSDELKGLPVSWVIEVVVTAEAPDLTVENRKKLAKLVEIEMSSSLDGE